MVVRLAYARGLLARTNPNRFQEWALEYWVYLDRRVHFEDQELELRMQCYNLSPDRWQELYGEEPVPEYPDSDMPEIPVTDISDLDEWYNTLGQSRTMLGADAVGAVL